MRAIRKSALVRPDFRSAILRGCLENSDLENSDQKLRPKKLRPSGVSKTQTPKNIKKNPSRKVDVPFSHGSKNQTPLCKVHYKVQLCKARLYYIALSLFPCCSSFINIPSDVLSRLRQSHLNLLEVELDYQEVCSSK